MLRRIEIRSHRLVTQLQAIVEDDGWLGAGADTGENDDLVSAAVLAHHAWVEWKRPGLVARRLTYERSQKEIKPQDMGTVLSYAFSQHLARINQNARRPPEKF
jgi:hypothetical protein